MRLDARARTHAPSDRLAIASYLGAAATASIRRSRHSPSPAPTAAAGLAVDGGIGAAGERGAAVVVSLATDVAFFLALFALLTPRPWHVRDLLPGVGLAGLGWLVLESLGGWYVDHAVAGASPTYGTFALGARADAGRLVPGS